MRRRSTLTRKTPLARGTKQLKRTGFKPRKKRMARTSTKTQTRKRKVAKLLYCDSFGVPFAEANTVALKIPFAMKDIKRPEVLRFMHERSGEVQTDIWTRDRTTFGRCWLSGEQSILTAHHVVSRWDFCGNILMCCWREHERIQHNTEALPEVLRALALYNPFVSWIHLIRARRSYFPFTTLD